MPLEWLLAKLTAVNHSVSGSFERCITVPAGTEVWRPQAAHSHELLAGKLPAGDSAASGTHEALRPAFLEKMFGARRLVRELLGEAGAGERAVMFPAARHANIIGTSAPPVNNYLGRWPQPIELPETAG